jgi:hypothetical protein
LPDLLSVPVTFRNLDVAVSAGARHSKKHGASPLSLHTSMTRPLRAQEKTRPSEKICQLISISIRITSRLHWAFSTRCGKMVK